MSEIFSHPAIVRLRSSFAFSFVKSVAVGAVWGFFITLACLFIIGTIVAIQVTIASGSEPTAKTITIKDQPPAAKQTLAFILAQAADGNPTPGPNPTPPTPDNKPKIGDKCPTCNGSGKVDGDHDGRPDFDCLDCGGDGRVDSGDPILTTSSPPTDSDRGESTMYATKETMIVGEVKKAVDEALQAQSEEFQNKLDDLKSRINEINAKVESQNPQNPLTKAVDHFDPNNRVIAAPQGRYVEFEYWIDLEGWELTYNFADNAFHSKDGSVVIVFGGKPSTISQTVTVLVPKKSDPATTIRCVVNRRPIQSPN